jgi:site-specific recombinase XerD
MRGRKEAMQTEVKIYAQAGLGHFVSYVDPFSKLLVKKRIGEREKAERYRDEIIRNLSITTSENPGEMLVRDLLQIHFQENPKTWLTREKSLVSDFLDTFGMLQLKELTTDMLRSWIDRMRIEKSLSESTAYSKKVVINIFFRDLVKKGILSVSPVDGVFYEKRPVENMRKPVVLSESYLNELLQKAKEYSPGIFYPMFLTFIETGAKSAEMIELKWEAVDFKKSTITFPGDKMLSERSVRISDTLQEALAKKRHVLDYVFTSLYDQKMTKRKISAYINDFKEHYGITEKWMYYDLRHSFAHHFISNGGDPKRLRELLGLRSHQTLETVYTKRPIKRIGLSSPYEG